MYQEQSEIDFPINGLQIYIFYIANLLRAFFKQECEITLTQYRILTIVELQDSRPRISDIALLLRTSPGTVSANVSDLVDKGLLCRLDGFDKLRLMHVGITESGRKLLRVLDSKVSYFFDNLHMPIGQYLKEMAVVIAIRSIEHFLEDKNSASPICSGYFHMESLLLFVNKLKELCHSHDLSVLEYCLLYYLDEECSDEKLSDVASDMLVSASHLASAVRSLTRRAYILRKCSSIDHRIFSLDLTPAGFTSMKQISDLFYQAVRAWMLHSPDDHIAVSKITRLNLGYLRNQRRSSILAQ
jgi:DNA-binding MarR family transcriptional regulator